MSPDPLDDLLANFARSGMPSHPESSKAIWREIEMRKSKSSWFRFLAMLDWQELSSEPRMAAAGVLLAIIVGAVPAYLVVARNASDTIRARESLHFEVFQGRHASVFVENQATEKL